MEQTSSISSRSLSVGRLRVLSSIARLWLLNRWLACLSLSGSYILVLKLTFSPDPFPRNLLLSNGLILRFFYPARVRKSLGVENIGQSD